MKAKDVGAALLRTIPSTDPRQLDYCPRSARIFNLAEVLTKPPFDEQVVAIEKQMMYCALVADALEHIEVRAAPEWMRRALKEGIVELRSSRETVQL